MPSLLYIDIGYLLTQSFRDKPIYYPFMNQLYLEKPFKAIKIFTFKGMLIDMDCCMS